MATRPFPARGYGASNNLLSRSQLSNPLRDFLKDVATRDRTVYFDDFLGDTINLDNYAVAQSQTSTNFAVVVGRNGTIAATTANVTTASVSIVTPAIWFGDGNAMIEGRFKVSTTASQVMEFGFIDLVPGSSAPGISDIDVPTFASTNVALLHRDTAQTHANLAFGTIGNFTGQTVATTLLTTSNSPMTAPAADTYLTVTIALQANVTGKAHAYCWINGRLVASHDTAAAGAVNGQIGLAGWFYFQTIAAGAKVVTMDYLKMAADRGASE